MALRDKLTAEKSERDAAAAEAQKTLRGKMEAQRRDAAVQQVRSRIAELQQRQELLTGIQRDLQEGTKEARGHIDTYKTSKRGIERGKSELQSADAAIDALLQEFPDLFREKGIESREQLLASPEFQEEAEIQGRHMAETAFSQARSARGDAHENLRQSIRQLRDTKANVKAEIPEAQPLGGAKRNEGEAKIADAIKVLQSEIEKLQVHTPEGRAEALELLRNEFEKSIPDMRVKDNGGTLSLERQGEVSIWPNQAIRFRSWRNTDLLPYSVSNQRQKYDWDIIREALTDAYRIKLEKVFNPTDRTYNSQEQIRRDHHREANEATKNQLIKLFDTAIDANILSKRVGELPKDNGEPYAADVWEARNKIDRLEEQKKEAQKMLGRLDAASKDIPDDTEVVKEKGYLSINVPSIETEIERLKNEILAANKEAGTVLTERRDKENKKPLLFGKKEWESQIAALKTKEDELYDWAQASNKTELPKLEGQRYVELTKRFGGWPTEAEKAIEALELKGKKSDAFAQIRKVLNDIISQQPPEGVSRLLADYKVLEKELGVA